MVECSLLLVARRLQHEISRVDGLWHLHIGVFNVFGFHIVVYLCISPLEVYSDVCLLSRYVCMWLGYLLDLHFRPLYACVPVMDLCSDLLTSAGDFICNVLAIG